MSLEIFLTQLVKIRWLLCTVNKRQLTNKDFMGLNYTIDCRACGSHTEFSTTMRCQADATSALHIADHIDTECAIRCPVCRARLNTSQTEFLSQVSISLEA